jgi:hypothetical protein
LYLAASVGREDLQRPAAELQRSRPDEDYVFFRLGNWLTDMSQLKDPPAFESAKTGF